MEITKIMTEEEFKLKCEEKGVPFTKALWNLYMDRMWDKTVEELEKDVEK